MSAVGADELAERLAEATRAAFRAYTTVTQQAREDLYALTMSGLGGCTRKAAYQLAKTPPSEEMVFGEMREANIGTMMHEGLLPHMAVILGGREEIPVTMTSGELTLKGRTDLYSERLKTCADLKTVGVYKFGMLSDTANRAHRLQVSGYALGLLQAKFEVEWVAWIYLDRSSGAEHIVVEPFSEELIQLVHDRCAELLLFAQEPESAPRDERGPGLSIICDSCPWLRECWGPDAAPGEIGAQRILARDHDGVARALALYDEARAREKEAGSDKEFAKAMFSGYEPGNYGDWTFTWSRAGEGNDTEAALALLAQAGVEIPKKRGSRRLIVRRSK